MPRSNAGKSGRPGSTLRMAMALGLLFVFVGLVLWIYVQVVWQFQAEAERNLFGDNYFGLASAALSGLAFAGSIYAIYMQRETLDETIRDLEESNWEAVYRDLDRSYQELLAVALDRPHLRDEVRIPHLEGRLRQEYEVYAYMVWNFIEAVVDRAENQKLKKTWLPTVKEEQRLHRAWFDEQRNRTKYRSDFATNLGVYLKESTEGSAASASGRRASEADTMRVPDRDGGEDQSRSFPQAQEPAA